MHCCRRVGIETNIDGVGSRLLTYLALVLLLLQEYSLLRSDLVLKIKNTLFCLSYLYID